MEQPLDAERLRMIGAVTRAYPSMRHSVVGAATMPALMFLISAYRTGDTSAIFLAFLALIPAFVAAEWVLGRYLTRRFGSVLESTGDVPFWRHWLPGIIGGLFGMFDKIDAWVIGSGGPSILILMLAAVALWATIRDWPSRRHMAGVVLICAVAAACAPHVAVGDRFASGRSGMEIVAMGAFMLGGLGDFLVLRRVMPRNVTTVDADV